MIQKIISGGQTGAERAALDAAVKLGIPYGGWIPKGRLTEDGALPEDYLLKEMPTSSFAKRAKQNILDSDGTLILTRKEPDGDERIAIRTADRLGRPCLHLDLGAMPAFQAAVATADWIYENRIALHSDPISGANSGFGPGTSR